MEDLIKALQIFVKYQSLDSPTHCSHDQLSIMGDYSAMTTEDAAELDALGFFYDEGDECWISFKFGSA